MAPKQLWPELKVRPKMQALVEALQPVKLAEQELLLEMAPRPAEAVTL